MSKKTIFPSDQELNDMRSALENSISSRPLARNATPVEKIKHRLCREFIVYKQSHQVTQKSLSEILGVDESIVSKILHYHFDDFTIDRLIKYLNILYPNLDFKIDLAS